MKIHFIGIGGIGVSALAKYYLEKDHQITGSDLVVSEITEALRKKGARIFIGKHKAKNLLKNVDMVVYSPAVPKDNPELKKAQKLKIKCLSYPQALGELTKQHFTIAISGTHGKSTTASMIGLLLVKAGLDPTVIVGTKLKEFGDSNCRMGESKYLVIEADEHFASFLNYWPKIIVLTNLEPDHLDYYKNFKNYILAFKKFISYLSKEGILVANKNDENVLHTFSTIVKNVCICWYSLKNKESKRLKKILKIPGEHNVSNALAALTTARVLKIPDKVSFKALSEYKGSWRRFEIKQLTINNKQLTIISDYAHHPTEIEVTLKAAREKWPKRKIWCVYQPHQYQRTYYLWNDFIKVFREALTKKFAWAHSPRRRINSLRGRHFARPKAERALFACDRLILADIYDVAGREEKKIKKKVSSKKIIEVIKNSKAIYLPKEKIIDYLAKNLQGGEVIIIMGAGDIYNLSLYLSHHI